MEMDRKEGFFGALDKKGRADKKGRSAYTEPAYDPPAPTFHMCLRKRAKVQGEEKAASNDEGEEKAASNDEGEEKAASDNVEASWIEELWQKTIVSTCTFPAAARPATWSGQHCSYTSSGEPDFGRP